MLYTYLLNELILCLYNKALLAPCVFEQPNKEHLPTCKSNFCSRTNICSMTFNKHLPQDKYSFTSKYLQSFLYFCLQIHSFVCYFNNQHVRNHGRCFALNNDQKTSLVLEKHSGLTCLYYLPRNQIWQYSFSAYHLSHQHCNGLNSVPVPSSLPSPQ